MLETPHVIVAAAIAVKVGRPELALPLALASHFILDIVPHWNPHINQEVEKFGSVSKRSTVIVAVDSAIALLTGSLIAYHTLPNYALVLTVLACCFLSVLPDLAEAPYFFLKMSSIRVSSKAHAYASVVIAPCPASAAHAPVPS